MKTRLNADVLAPGDIVLTSSSTLLSRKVRAGTLSRVSHAMLYVVHSSIIHADSEGVHAANTQRIFFDEKDTVIVKRLKGGMTPLVANKICDFARQLVGSEYDTFEAVRSAIKRGRNLSAKQFCSRLVAQSYNSQGIKLVGDPNYCTPGGILKSNLLEDVPNCTMPVDNREYEFWQNDEIPDTPNLTLVATNFILRRLREIDPKIQTFSDIGLFVIRHPEHDELVNNLLSESGYLDIWKFDYKEHPWRWNLSEMNAAPNMASIEKYCKATIKGDPRDDNRFTKNLIAIVADNAKYPRTTFSTLILLYEQLASLHRIRFDTASSWLATNRSNTV